MEGGNHSRRARGEGRKGRGLVSTRQMAFVQGMQRSEKVVGDGAMREGGVKRVARGKWEGARAFR